MRALARWVSIVGHPFVSIIALVVVLESRHGEAAASRSALAVALLFILPLTLLMIHQVRRGAWTTVDASLPRERRVLYIAGVIALLTLIAFLAITRPRSGLLPGAVGTFAFLIVCAVATRWIKVSLHMAVASLVAAILLRLSLPLGWAFGLILPMLAWSRVVLGRHRWTEVALGFFFGVAAGLAIVATA